MSPDDRPSFRPDVPLAPNSFDSSLDLIGQIPSFLLERELSRRHGGASSSAAAAAVGSLSSSSPGGQPACGGGPDSSPGYNTSLHIFGLCIILVLSTLSCALPLIVRNAPSLPTPHTFLFLCRHFGTGVLLATAFVHLLPTAFGSLADPCLPFFWTQTFPQMPGFIALLAVFAVVSIEMYFATKGVRHDHSFPERLHPKPEDDPEEVVLVDRPLEASEGSRDGDLLDPHNPSPSSTFHSPFSPKGGHHHQHDHHHQQFHRHHHHHNLALDGHDDDDRIRLLNPDPPPSSLAGLAFRNSTESDSYCPRSGNRLDDSPSLPTSTTTGGARPHLVPGVSHQRLHHSDGPQTAVPVSGPNSRSTAERDVLQVVLLEAGILFHSVFIGLSLSTTRGTTFVVLLLAISLHQTFEGLALGSRIAAVRFPPVGDGLGSEKGLMASVYRFCRRWQPWLMCLAFGITTPIGQAIGLAVHNLFDPAGQLGLILVGCTNAVSSGFLLFAGLVSLLADDFLSERSYEKLTGARRKIACGCVVAGALAMSIVGIWA